MHINAQAIDTLKTGALWTTGAACFGAVLGACVGANYGAFIAICNDVTFSNGIATGAKWGALGFAGVIALIGGAMTTDAFLNETRKISHLR